MINLEERHEDILRVIKQLDISPTMFKNANEKYHAIANYLTDVGIDAEIYPQGSFAFGTVVRPSVKDQNACYDLDFVCQIVGTRDNTSPSDLRIKIKDALESSDRYGGKLTVWPECFTIEYADINGIGFNIDIVPATDDSLSHKAELSSKSVRPDLIPTSVVIPRESEAHSYRWITNNPLGFLAWFNEINMPFLQYNQEYRRQKFFYENAREFASVKDIPNALDRSSIQRVIQIMKYHRDNYYLHLKDGDDIKPISAIITMLVASISKSANPSLDVFELLNFVLSELNIYSLQQTLSPYEFRVKYGNRSILHRDENKKWILQNPANPEDNLADKWNQNSRIPEMFFRWITACKNDLIVALELHDEGFRTAAENAFGSQTIQHIWGDKYKPASKSEPRPITNNTKPYCCEK